MRGTRIRAERIKDILGIIPAYAGNTPRVRRNVENTGDHPRVCGEHECGDESVWGNVGIIPAYAGNTVFYVPGMICLGDHPRVCGEHGCADRRSVYFQGSSPRMRGTLRDVLDDGVFYGIIPAYAGNT